MTHDGRWRRWLAASIAGGLLVVTVAGGGTLLAAHSDSACSAVEAGSIKMSASFTPADAVRSRLPEIAISSRSGGPDSVPSGMSVPSGSIDGRDLRWVDSSSTGTYQYFLDQPMGKDVTPDAFLAMGGIQYGQEPANGESFAGYLIDVLGERAVAVKIGQYAGALTWADPLPNNVRSHNVYWSDGTTNFALIGDRPAAEMVTLARKLVC
jgi:hypothetical protein